MKNILENWHKYLSENQKRKINIFLDMDGVLVDFASSVREYIKDGYSVDADIFFPDSKSSRALHRKLQRLNLSSSELEDLYDRAAAKFQSGEEYSPQEHLIHNYIFKILINNKDLWLSMKKLTGADNLVRLAFNIADNVFVLTAQVDETSKEAKKEWIARHFPQIDPANVNVDRDKGGRLKRLVKNQIVSGTDLNILIDDRKHFLKSFIDAGGQGVQYNYESPDDALQALERILATN
jgi:5'(3')-deoxyribonucleotidase|tara:strand:- start:3131 stop:3841 length:711 start_codon:yes stop_codon:yes gene_type:complete